MPLQRFTHLARIYGFKCYFNEFTNEVKGINWLNDQLIEIFVGIDILFFDNVEFKIELIEEI